MTDPSIQMVNSKKLRLLTLMAIERGLCGALQGFPLAQSSYIGGKWSGGRPSVESNRFSKTAIREACAETEATGGCRYAACPYKSSVTARGRFATIRSRWNAWPGMSWGRGRYA